MWSERAVPVWSPGYSKQKATETCQVFTKEETLQDPENIVALQPASIFFFYLNAGDFLHLPKNTSLQGELF